MKLLDPRTLMALKNLSLAAKTTVDGFMTGMHQSSIKGPGMEFSQYRSYQPGDDPRSLDWKMFARSDRYYIRESEIETSISIRFLCDTSASMNHRDGQFTKLDFSKYVIASLAWLAHSQGDATGLYIFKEQALSVLPASKGHQHLNRLLYQLEQLQAGGTFTHPAGYRNVFLGSQKKELLVFVTDFYQQKKELSDMLRLAAALRHEVMVLHVLAPNEVDLDFGNYTSVEDLETGQVIRVDAQALRKTYMTTLNIHLSEIRTEMLNLHIFYSQVQMNEDIGNILRNFLKQRNQVNP